jgi:acyl carrier protein
MIKNMEEKKIRRNLYRVLRKTGVQKQKIQLYSSFNDDLKFDTVDWSIFAYYLEGVFKISINDDDLVKLENVNKTIQYLGNTA